ncbi:MAG: hypothetical protein AAGG68_28355 [Bacteroidota bacterium]
MKITLKVEEAKADFFLELLHNFEDFITIESTTAPDLTPMHKEILDERLDLFYKAEPEDLLDWEEVEKELAASL